MLVSELKLLLEKYPFDAKVKLICVAHLTKRNNHIDRIEVDLENYDVLSDISDELVDKTEFRLTHHIDVLI